MTSSLTNTSIWKTDYAEIVFIIIVRIYNDFSLNHIENIWGLSLIFLNKMIGLKFSLEN